MTGLVEDLLLLARVDESRDLAREPVELAQLVATAVADAQVATPDHSWIVDAPAPAIVPGDEPRLHQAVANLLANAAVHTPAGTSVVARVRVDDEHALLEVEDDGPGIPAADRARVLERFQRGAHAVPGGSGLGLAIVAQQAALHHGTLDVETGRLGGARLVLRIAPR